MPETSNIPQYQLSKHYQKKLKILEKEILSYFINLLEIHKILHWRQHTGGVPARVVGTKVIFRKNQNSGMPDVMGVCPSGKLFVAEIKRPHGRSRLSEKQQHWLKRFECNNCLVKVIDSYETAIDFLIIIKAS